MSGYRLNDMNAGRHCKDCTDRYPGCHGKCEKYLSCRKEWEEYKASIDAKRKEEQQYLDFKIQRITEGKKAANDAKHCRSWQRKGR